MAFTLTPAHRSALRYVLTLLLGLLGGSSASSLLDPAPVTTICLPGAQDAAGAAPAGGTAPLTE